MVYALESEIENGRMNVCSHHQPREQDPPLTNQLTIVNLSTTLATFFHLIVASVRVYKPVHACVALKKTSTIWLKHWFSPSYLLHEADYREYVCEYYCTGMSL